MLWKKKKLNNSLIIILSNTVAKQYKLYSANTEGFQHELSSRFSGLLNLQKDAEEKAHAWASVTMVSCVANPHESEAKCANDKRWESNWYLSEIGLLLAMLAAVDSPKNEPTKTGLNKF